MTKKTIELDDVAAKALYEALAPHFEGSPEEVVKVAGQGDWTKSELKRFKAEVAPYKGAVGMLNLTARRAGQEVRYGEVLKDAGVPDRQARSDLGAMTKITTIMFGERRWPVRNWQASDGIMTYVMPDEIAKWWLES